MKKLLYFTSYVDGSVPFILSDQVQGKVEVDVMLVEWSADQIQRQMETKYDYIYIRSPFTNLQVPLKEVEQKTQIVLDSKKDAYIVDGISDWAGIMEEDKWVQYEMWGEFMADTHILTEDEEIDFQKNIIKKRLSTRGRDIYFSKDNIEGSAEEFIVQGRIPMVKEHRIYGIFDELINMSSVKSPKTETQKVKVIGSQKVSRELMDFVKEIDKKVKYDFIGYDIAETKSGELFLIEVNRSPLFTKFYEQTGKNLVESFTTKLLEKK